MPRRDHSRALVRTEAARAGRMAAQDEDVRFRTVPISSRLSVGLAAEGAVSSFAGVPIGMAGAICTLGASVAGFVGVAEVSVGEPARAGLFTGPSGGPTQSARGVTARNGLRRRQPPLRCGICHGSSRVSVRVSICGVPRDSTRFWVCGSTRRGWACGSTCRGWACGSTRCGWGRGFTRRSDSSGSSGVQPRAPASTQRGSSIFSEKEGRIAHA